MSRLPTLRPATADDAGPIARLSRDEIERGLRWEWTPHKVRTSLTHHNTLGVVAEAEAELAGFCLGSYGLGQMHILLLAVTPAQRRARVGSALLAWHLACCRVAAIERVTLELVATNTAARRFYERFGFVVSKTVRGYYQRRLDALQMQLELGWSMP